VPRTSTRTGLIECPAHQFGGSTFVTLGAWAASALAAPAASANSNETIRMGSDSYFIIRTPSWREGTQSDA
jgi:hypothetical protein